jgi:hypothetical protein
VPGRGCNNPHQHRLQPPLYLDQYAIHRLQPAPVRLWPCLLSWKGWRSWLLPNSPASVLCPAPAWITITHKTLHKAPHI